MFPADSHVKLDRLNADGHVLDVGGGGEGVIGKLAGRSVVAMEKTKRELEEAPDGPLKVIMDAPELQIWDTAIPERLPGSKDILAVRVTAELPDETIHTGYRVRWPELDATYLVIVE